MACEQTERICYGVEIEPKFVDVAVKRYIEFKGGSADDVYVIRDGKKLNYADVEIPEEQTDGGE
jgi:DNA modification methylase